MREKFLQIYANIPISLCNRDIIYVLDNKEYHNEPMTWNACYIEIKNDTPVGQEILKGLSDLNII